MTKGRVFEGRRVLVTGAASGIGRATALEFARRGAGLALTDIDGVGLDGVVREVEALGARATSHVADVSNAVAVEALATAALAGGPVDVLVNNAGVATVGAFARSDPAEWERMVGVNLWGPLRLTRALVPSMIERRSGHVAVVASLAGLIGTPGMAVYGATKFAMVGFAEALRVELAGRGVGVTVVCPGFVRTGFAAATRYEGEGFRRFLQEPPGWYGLSGERVARALVDAVEARRPRVVLGPEKAGWWLKRLSPELAHVAAVIAARWSGVLGDGARR